MKKYTFILISLLALCGVAYAGWYDGQYARLLLSGFADLTEQANEPGDPDSDVGRLYVKDDGASTTTLYFKDSAGTETNLLSPTVTTAFDDIGDPDANGSVSFSTYTATLTGASVAADQFNFLNTGNFGDVSVVKIQQLTGNPTDGTLLEVTGADTNIDGVVISNTTADLTTDATLLTLSLTDDGDANGIFINCLDNSGGDTMFKVADDGDTTVNGDMSVGGTLSVTGPFYQTAIASASAGNVNLAIDAAGSGTITIGATSTGKISTDNLLEALGNVDIGDNSADTLSISASIDSDVTLDDGTGASPSLTFQDATNETAVLSKADAGYLTITTVAGDGVSVRTGNLTVGNGSAGTAAMDGEDAYIEGELEVDGTSTFDSQMTVNAAIALENGATIDNASDGVIEINEASEELKLTFGSNAIDFSSTTGVNSLEVFDGTSSSITKAADGAADDFTFSLTGAQDSSLIIASAGTGADALQISTSAGGMDITVAGAAAGEDLDILSSSSINVTATEAEADQIKLDAQGTVAGNAIDATTTDGGIILDANGAANGDITIDAADVLTLVTPDTILINGGTGAIEFEGASADAFETTLAITDPTADRTITVPDYSGALPLIVSQGATQTSANNATEDVTGSSVSLPDGLFSAGKSLKWTLAGTITGGNAAKQVILYVDDAAIITFTTDAADAGDYMAEFTMHEHTDFANQKCFGKLDIAGNAQNDVDYATDTTDFNDGGATTVKCQVVSGNAGDTITVEYVKVEMLD